LGDGVVLQILFPDRDPAGMETNTSSIIARLVYGENEFLFTGDSPKSIENYLISLGGLESDVLKAGHHGSKTSTSPDFVTAVSPEYVVISAGKDNRYGHPSQEVLDILNNFGAEILRTDKDGRIVFESDGESLKIK
ncbi:MAG: internalization-related competence protein ComEC/Rec2 protein, partial [Parcubacteria group bacterium GW2011_GWB1_35_5]